MITSSRHDNARKAKRKKQLGILFGVVLIILIFRSPVEGVLSGMLQFIARPFLSIENSIRDTFSGYTFLLKSKSGLVEENRRLKDALDVTILDSYSREALRRENDELKLVLNRHVGRTILIARVLASPGYAPYDTLVIDAGSRDGLTVDMKVFIDSDFIIGEITRVFAHSAIVTLYSSNGTEIPVTINTTGTSSIPTIGYGIGGGNFRSILPRGIDIRRGALVDIPAIAPTYAGIIESAVKSNESSLQSVYFKLPVNVFTLRYVYVATNQEISTTTNAE